jgi:hypothetical protein
MNETIPAGMMMDMADYDGGRFAKLAYTPAEAKRIADLFREMGGFRVEEKQMGDSCYGPRGYDVMLWAVNRAAGNTNLFCVPLEAGIDLKRAKAIAKDAKAKFSGRDNAAFRRMAAEREMNRE